MHRVLALLLLPGLIATSGVVSSLHVHMYDDHDHPEHHHGLAAHRHQQLTGHPDGRSAHLKGCDPGRHAVSFAFVCSAPPQLHAADAQLTLAGTPAPARLVERSVRRADVRVHGPPARAQSPPRAPPQITHA